MKKLKVWQKLALLGIILLIPFAVVLAQLFSSVRTLSLHPAELEIAGVDYITPLRGFMHEVQTHRAMTHAYHSGETAFKSKLQGQEDTVEAAVAKVDDVDQRLGGTLDASKQWQAVKADWKTLANESSRLSTQENLKRHNSLIISIISLIQRVGDTSTLTLDPDLDAYYLMKIVVFTQPELSNRMGHARVLGVGALARHRLDINDRLELTQQEGVIDYLVSDVFISTQKAIEQDSRLAQDLQQPELENNTKAQAFLSTVRSLQAGHLVLSTSSYFDEASKSIDASYKLSDAASPALTKLLQERIGRLNSQMLRTLIWALLGLLVVSLIGWLLIRDVTKPLKNIVEIAEKVASGDLNTRLESGGRRDELGSLIGAFNRMGDSLRAKAAIADEIAAGHLNVHFDAPGEQDVLGQSLDKMLRQLRSMTENISGAVNQLGSSSTEILASTSQLSATAAETASAITETTTTVEEVRQTAHVSNEKAQMVAQTAGHAAETALHGREATESGTQGMLRIREQMDAIAQSMIRLSEQSSAIGEIITSVDDLTQQSNLLAVNAAIEAAKAGEQGKGFAVVAQEVKNLAEQSRRATSQVRTILGDIQKATGAAVMATEQGTKVVEAGVAQSTQAGEAIAQLSEGIEEASQASIQIAASSQQQLIGVDQVAIAMDNVRQASLQNVESAHQLEAAARDLNSLGLRLKELIELYQA